MKKILLINCILFLLFSCSEENDLKLLKKEHPETVTFIDSLISKNIILKKCIDCKLPEYDGKFLYGYTPSDLKETLFYNNKKEIGKFNYNSFYVFKNIENKFAHSTIYFCYLSDKQLKILKDFSQFYTCKLARGKQPSKVKFYRNTAVIEIQNLP